MVELNSDDVSIINVTELIEKDMALAAQILKVANSPAYGATKAIGSIHHAIIMLGLQEVRALLLAFAVQKFFTINESNTKFRQRFWTHSRACSYSALTFAQHFKQDDSSTFFLSGLIHDIGKLITDQFLHEEFQQIITYIQKHNCSFNVAEQHILGITHSQIAGNLLQHWNFPKQVTTHILHHHAPWKESDFSSGTFIIFLANIVTKMAGYTCLDQEPTLDIDKFSKLKAIQIINQNGFEVDSTLLEKIRMQVTEFVGTESQ